ncbi:uncharacterized protein AFUA_8G01200 [Aspergillus fumigatus Af293]|uniref:Uncharacterized protein n=1 Tax=Aspergillus fumigatus (strain ATCC MYA-4609 / CBS 101355 / FGSC A1100 / Af293) TaxID=330879 RepID=Q4WB64_ASPFU|nr:hypothetical protein AFUA_8G01200 [Aspergillus fumigatus Af293]EAL85048.1 hypothetical protein AFUA_8G01200 [Aspergillus fumigatus Af293]
MRNDVFESSIVSSSTWPDMDPISNGDARAAVLPMSVMEAVCKTISGTWGALELSINGFTSSNSGIGVPATRYNGYWNSTPKESKAIVREKARP